MLASKLPNLGLLLMDLLGHDTSMVLPAKQQIWTTQSALSQNQASFNSNEGLLKHVM